MQEDTRGNTDPYALFGTAPPAYGAAGPAGQAYAAKPMFRSRKRLNVLAIFASLFAPWVLFSGYFALLSFGFHYYYPSLMGFFFAGGILVSLMPAYYALTRKSSGASREASWLVFICLSVVLAWVLALALGFTNFRKYMVQYNDMMHLNEYHEIQPTTMRGEQYSDAGPVYFSNKSSPDLTKAMGFMNLKQYCVAPITEGSEPLGSYDFWVVGSDCCSVRGADFHCENAHNSHIHGGLRLTNDLDRAFFRLAVQQAEAAHNITANHPLFFTWVDDPVRVMRGWKVTVLSNFLFGMFGYFLFQAFIVIIATLAFSRAGDPK